MDYFFDAIYLFDLLKVKPRLIFIQDGLTIVTRPLSHFARSQRGFPFQKDPVKLKRSYWFGSSFKVAQHRFPPASGGVGSPMQYDLFSLLPLDIFYFAVGRVNPLLRLPRLLKVLQR